MLVASRGLNQLRLLPGTALAPFPGEAVLQSLEEHLWSVGATAKAPGVSKGYLYTPIERNPSVRTAKELTREELKAALQSTSDDLDATSKQLRVSRRYLTLRLRQLGLSQ